MLQFHSHMYSKILELLALVLILVTCTIIEDRAACPCRVEFRVDGSFKADEGVDIVVLGTQGQFAFHHHYDAWEASLPVFVDVPDREGADILVCPGFLARFVTEGGSLVFPSGASCPEMPLYSATVSTEPENVTLDVTPHKNHCNITVRFSDSFPANCVLQLSSSVCGMAPGGKPVDGVFRQNVPLGASGVAVCRLPRQKDFSAMLDIITPDDVTRHIALGNMMQQAGYDWSAEELGDITLDIDYTLSNVHLKFAGWDREIFLPVVI